MSRVDSTPPSPDPWLGSRLRDVTSIDPSVARMAKLLSHAAADPMPKGAQPWSRIEDKLATRLRPNPRMRWLWPAIAITSLVLTTGAVAGPTLVRWVQRSQLLETKSKVVSPTPSPIAKVQRVQAALSLPLAPAPAGEPLRSAKAPVHAMKPAPRAFAMTAPVKAEPPLLSALAAESKLLGTALASLRKDKDAARTLAILDDYQGKFPQGELAGEAQRTRIEALLLQRRTPEALAVLNSMTFATRARDNEWRVLRGELRANAHHCAQAQSDFSEALKINDKGPIAERALFGRASCFLELKDTAAAHAALVDYAARFPSGAHAVQVRKALDVSAP